MGLLNKDSETDPLIRERELELEREMGTLLGNTKVELCRSRTKVIVKDTLDSITVPFRESFGIGLASLPLTAITPLTSFFSSFYERDNESKYFIRRYFN